MSGSRFTSRTLARSQALQLLFQAQATGNLVSDVLSREFVTTGDPNEAEELVIVDGQLDPYARELALGADGMLHELDSVIGDASTNWSVGRMPSVDRNILRLAVYEMSTVDDVDVAVSINEFVELAKAYGTDESARFVNGILGRVATMLEEDDELLGAYVDGDDEPDEPAAAEGDEAEDAPETPSAEGDEAEDAPEVPSAEGDEAEDAPEAPSADDAADDLPAWAREG